MNNSRSDLFTAAIIPLVPALLPGSSSLPEGSQFAATCATAKGACFLSKTRSTSRAGSPLLFGLAPRGVFRASGVTTGAVGSYPTFSPLPNVARILASLRFPCAAATVLRSAGGLFSVALSVSPCSGRLLRRAITRPPWRYQARCPCREFHRSFASTFRRPQTAKCLTTVSGLSSRLP